MSLVKGSRIRALYLLFLLSLSGCASVMDMADDQKIYGGTQFIGERAGESAVFGPCSNCGPWWLFDLPLSLAVDTICLPVTVTLAIFRSSKEETSRKTK